MDTDKRRQLHELLDLVLDTNGFEERVRAATGNMPTMFFEYSGHTNSVRIDLHSNGWMPKEKPDRSWRFYLDLDDPQETIDDIREAVNEALEGK